MSLLDRCIRMTIVMLAGILCFTLFTIAEEITLTNYFPAPSGNYTELDVDDLDVDDLHVTRLAVGTGTVLPTVDGDVNVQPGDVDVGGTLTAGRFDAGIQAGQSGGPFTLTLDGTYKEIRIKNGIVVELILR